VTLLNPALTFILNIIATVALAFAIPIVAILFYIVAVLSWRSLSKSRFLPRQVRPKQRYGDAPFIETVPSQTIPQLPFHQTPLVQSQKNGRMVWHPTPTLALTEAAPLEEAWISTTIEAPRIVRQGKTVIVRVEVSNNHRTKPLRDEAMLEVEHPSSALQILGAEQVSLQPQGDTTHIYSQWTAPYVPGSYVLRFTILNHNVRAEKVLVVE